MAQLRAAGRVGVPGPGERVCPRCRGAGRAAEDGSSPMAGCARCDATGVVAAVTKPLTATMVACIDMAREAGGELVRYQGGYWAPRGRGHPAATHEAFHGASTVQGVVDRGFATYSEWREGRGQAFPIAMTLTPEDAA